MRMRLVLLLLPICCSIYAGAFGATAAGTTIRQDPHLLRLVERMQPWYPDSVFVIIQDNRHQTPSGSYRSVIVERTCNSRYLAGAQTVIIDEVRSQAWFGTVANLNFDAGVADLRHLKAALELSLPAAMRQSTGLNVTVDWDEHPDGSGVVIPFALRVDSGYGEYLKPAAVTSDGQFLILGSSIALDGDPVAERRRLFRESDSVIWDHDPEDAALEIVEFSDFECPGCRHKWTLIKSVVEGRPYGVRHGMVTFPLTRIHPWAFRSAAAAWCVSEQNRFRLSSFKELFYSLQREMGVSLVTPTSLDFVAAEDLNEDQFLACYLKAPSLDGVHGQMALGHRLGVAATPTYFVNGWMVQVPGESWFEGFSDRLARGLEP